jgi:hypothetical protein
MQRWPPRWQRTTRDTNDAGMPAGQRSPSMQPRLAAADQLLHALRICASRVPRPALLLTGAWLHSW